MLDTDDTSADLHFTHTSDPKAFDPVLCDTHTEDDRELLFIMQYNTRLQGPGLDQSHMLSMQLTLCR